MRPYIKIIVSRPDGLRSTARIAGEGVTAPMIDAADDLLTTMLTGQRPLPKRRPRSTKRRSALKEKKS